MRSIFKFHFNNALSEMNAYIQKLVWADGSGSDLFAILSAYRVSMAENAIINIKNSYASLKY